METHYKTIGKRAMGEFRDRGSKFLAYAMPFDDLNSFKPFLAELKKEHPKASHYCFAYRLGTDKLVFRVSDDAEPSGSAGRPILGQLDSRELTNALVIVVRYFGGTLLGVTGLINAYKTSASLSLDNAGVITKPIMVSCTLRFDYTMMNEVMRIIKQYNGVITRHEALLFSTMQVDIPVEKKEEAFLKLGNLAGVELA